MAVNLESKTLLGNWVEEVYYLCNVNYSTLNLCPSGNVLVLNETLGNQMAH